LNPKALTGDTWRRRTADENPENVAWHQRCALDDFIDLMMPLMVAESAVDRALAQTGPKFSLMAEMQ
jgi:hypothetical protein